MNASVQVLILPSVRQPISMSCEIGYSEMVWI